MKKILSIVICAAMILCLVACGNASAGKATLPQIDDAEAAGVLFVSIGAEFKVIYDEDGLVMAVESTEDAFDEISDTYSDAVGSPCDTVVSQLIKRTIEAEKHGATRVVVLKQAPGSKNPSANFLEDTRVDAAAVTDFEIVLISAKELTAEGYITPESAKDILTRQLKLVDVTVNCSEVEEATYTLTFESEGAEREYKMDAATGTVILDITAVDPFEIPEGGVDEFGNPVAGEPEVDLEFPEEEIDIGDIAEEA